MMGWLTTLAAAYFNATTTALGQCDPNMSPCTIGGFVRNTSFICTISLLIPTITGSSFPIYSPPVKTPSLVTELPMMGRSRYSVGLLTSHPALVFDQMYLT